MRIPTLAGSMVGLLTAMVAVPPASPSRSMSEPCCNITAIDAAKRLVTVTANQGWAVFEVTIADAAQLRTIRRGQAAGLSQTTLTLFVYPTGGSVQAIRVTGIAVKPPAGPSARRPSSASSLTTAQLRARDASTTAFRSTDNNQPSQPRNGASWARTPLRARPIKVSTVLIEMPRVLAISG